MKICFTKTSDHHFEIIRECKSLKACIDYILSKEEELFDGSVPEVVVSKPREWDSEETRECDYRIEIYDDYRE